MSRPDDIPDNVQRGDWLSRVVLPDVYPRREDPFRPRAAVIPSTVPPASMVPASDLVAFNAYDGWITGMGQRPVVYQRALNFQLTTGVVPVPIMNEQFQCDAFLINNLSTNLNSVFFGFGSSITIASGQEIRVGIPQFFSPDNTRELWEVQRVLEQIASIIAIDKGLDPLGEFRAPRVVLNANEYFIVAAAGTVVQIMLFLIPEMQ